MARLRKWVAAMTVSLIALAGAGAVTAPSASALYIEYCGRVVANGNGDFCSVGAFHEITYNHTSGTDNGSGKCVAAITQAGNFRGTNSSPTGSFCVNGATAAVCFNSAPPASNGRSFPQFAGAFMRSFVDNSPNHGPYCV